MESQALKDIIAQASPRRTNRNLLILVALLSVLNVGVGTYTNLQVIEEPRCDVGSR